ncbi:MAG: thioesterase [Rhodospirillaceae bacterium]|nr:thioesterase [Rhodospirillaceae bacterium]|tara:strand:- start:553 stop:1035 length:483 start_codon:yes stop_codon:yes gene_type:complete
MIDERLIKVDLGMKVEPSWIDYNGHMNVTYYLLAFDKIIDEFNNDLGLGIQYRNDTNKSTYALESHIIWIKEMLLGERMNFTIQLLDHDKKKLHLFLTMLTNKENIEVATYEVLSMHINLKTKKSCHFPNIVQKKIENIMNIHYKIPKPRLSGSTVGIRR